MFDYWNPIGGVSNYSQITNNINVTHSFIYSGDMNLDFNSTTKRIDIYNSPVSIDPTGSIIDFTFSIRLEFREFKFEIIDHYINNNTLTGIKFDYVTTSTIFGNFSFTIPKSDITISNSQIIIIKYLNEINSAWVFNDFTDIYDKLNSLNAATITITLI